MTPWLIKWMILQYVVIVAFSCYERRWHWALYYAGATAISIAVLGMQRR